MNTLIARAGPPSLWLVGAVLWSVIVAAPAHELPTFTALAEHNSPTVVNISTVGRTLTASAHGGLDIPSLPEDHPLNDLFRKFFGDQDEDNGAEEFDSESLGSGVIISEDGYILTNYHVIGEADEIIVRLWDRRQLPATVIGTDERSDIALIKVDADGLPTATLGKSSRLKVGEWVLAIGSPFGFEHSVTSGIISALGRSLPSENYVPFIQTDVAINPGNSGGPLLNLDGQVVGINSQIYSRTGGFMGLSFAIPIDVAMEIADQLKSQGRVSRGWLGVLIQDVTGDLAQSFGMPTPQGALVAQVQADSPADRAGFEPGDIILGYNGKPVTESAKLPPMVGRTQVGSRVPVEIIRDGESERLMVDIGELEEARLAARGPKTEPRSESADRLGVTVADLSEAQREALDVGQGGVLVEDVRPGLAQRAGIEAGDVILMLNDERVKDAGHFQGLVQALPQGKKTVAVLVQRQEGPIFLPLPLAD
jgi:serine protease Do